VRYVRSIALLYVTLYWLLQQISLGTHCRSTYRPCPSLLGHWAHICRVSFVDFYKNTAFHAHCRCIPYGKVIDQTGCWGDLFLENVMYVCKTFSILTRQNAPTMPFQGHLFQAKGLSHPSIVSAPTAPRSSYLLQLFPNSRSTIAHKQCLVGSMQACHLLNPVPLRCARPTADGWPLNRPP